MLLVKVMQVTKVSRIIMESNRKDKAFSIECFLFMAKDEVDRLI